MKWMVIPAVLSLVAQSTAAQQQSVSAPEPVPQIATSATGEARVQPDRATIVFAVETRAATAARAGADNARRQRAVLDS